MWPGEQLLEALDVCDATGAPWPIAAAWAAASPSTASQATRRSAVLDRGPVGLVAAHVLVGTLSGKYLDDPNGPGRAGRDNNPVARRGKDLAMRLAELGSEWGLPAAHLAIAYALGHPNLASVLFGATSPEQVLLQRRGRGDVRHTRRRPTRRD